MPSCSSRSVKIALRVTNLMVDEFTKAIEHMDSAMRELSETLRCQAWNKNSRITVKEPLQSYLESVVTLIQHLTEYIPLCSGCVS